MSDKKRGKVKLELHVNTLQALIFEAEADGPLKTRGELWAKIESLPKAKAMVPRALTAAVAMARFKEFTNAGVEFEIKTPVGKRGGDGNFGGKRGRQPGQVSTKKRRISVEAEDAILDRFPNGEYDDVILKAEAGSLKAAVKLNCLACSSWKKSEVRHCAVKKCPLYGFRPYQGKSGQAEIDQEANEPELVQIGS